MSINLLKRTALILAGAITLASCGGGGGNGTTPGTPTDGEFVPPLAIVSYVASPITGPSPLGVTFTATVSGGTLPVTYYWDFNNDGAFDMTTPPSGSRTATAYHSYQLKAEDAQIKVSTYEATVKIVDDNGRSITSTPITVTVTDAPNFSLEVSITSDFVDFRASPTGGEPEVVFMYLSGQPVYFRALVQHIGTGPETGPYTFSWDFDGDGRADSSLQNPQYTFTLVGDEVERKFAPSLTVMDSLGMKVVWQPDVPSTDPSYPYVILREVIPAQPGTPEVIVNTSPPADIGDVIRITYNSNSDDPETQEPRLGVAASVRLARPGTPPYNFRWDFTGDGRVDATTPHASVPYFDPSHNQVVNPYKISGAPTREFTLVFSFTDAGGYMETRTFTVIVSDTAFVGQINPVQVEALVDLDGDAEFNVDPNTPIEEQQFKVLTDAQVEDFRTDADGNRFLLPYPVKVKVRATGSTGDYEYFIDPFGNGSWAHDPDGDSLLNWDPTAPIAPGNVLDFDANGETIEGKVDSAEGGGVIFTINYLGGLDPPETQGTFRTAFLPGFKAIRVKVVAYDRGLPTSTEIVELPVSLLVTRTRTFSEDSETPIGRDHFGFVGVTTSEGRRAYIIGGMSDNVALRSVQMIFQPWETSAPNDFTGFVDYYLLTDRLPLLEAVGQMAFASPSPLTGFQYIYAMGGFNNTGGVLSTVERLPAIDGTPTDATEPWGTVGTFGNSDVHNRLAGATSASILAYVDGDLQEVPVVFVMGGLEGQARLGSVSSTVWTYFPDFSFWSSAFGDPAPMPTPRYDFASVFIREPDGDKYIYVMGGRANDGTSLNTVERLKFDFAGPGSKAWEALPDMLVPRAGASAKVIDGKIYVFGGAIYPAGGFGEPTYVDTVEILNPDLKTWSRSAPLPLGPLGFVGTASFPSTRFGTAVTYPEDTIWIYGGVSGGDTEGSPSYSTGLMEYYLEDWRASQD